MRRGKSLVYNLISTQLDDSLDSCINNVGGSGAFPKETLQGLGLVQATMTNRWQLKAEQANVPKNMLVKRLIAKFYVLA